MSSETISEGDQIVIQKAKVLKVVQVRKGRKIWLDRVQFSADELIGKPFGCTFEENKGVLVQVSRTGSEDADNAVEEGKRDNRDLQGDQSNQKITKSEIQEMRKQGVSGQEIIEQLVENSATFKKKNTFSQEKYLKKKKKKRVYQPQFTIMKPTTRLVADMYYSRGPMRICNMRPDSLAQILALGNVRSGNRMMVVESCVGVLVSAMLERMAGSGLLVDMYSGSAPVHQACECFNFTKQHKDILKTFPLDRVAELHGVEKKKAWEEEREKEGEEEEEEKEEVVEEVKEEVEKEEGAQKKRKRISPEERDERRIRKAERIKEMKEVLMRADMDGLIVATKFHPTPIVLSLLDFICPSRPIVVFSQYKEPLLDLYSKLKERGGIILLKLTETWFREYQVLPNRTHPLVNMIASGGYILTGTTVSQD
ncbi:hypothetical protein CAPTEDRAFT_113381 [Capitella teleta]|uniref:tRNA (adenine(58)-N(1))-methyltransferase non-catalytic subunit TRM6 n=1 Tax=Capitella teleta TaxID=283909 RepID=R7TWE2_CAPTE|nr:hypothetical protein CAPTEDRAFT_113381 [Capitella teleta]|eukprot:ELT95756.1 hypothetical protein CAPTEDRAFT_113381 [Capitella teleta]